MNADNSVTARTAAENPAAGISVLRVERQALGVTEARLNRYTCKLDEAFIKSIDGKKITSREELARLEAEYDVADKEREAAMERAYGAS